MALHPVDAYARSVVAGRVLAGKYHRLACVRHERDRAREATRAFPYRFDARRADRFYRFAEKLRHYRAEWAGQYIALQPHQKFRLGSLFAWVHTTTGLRRFRTAYNEIPRKNGKSLEAAIVALYVTFFDGEPGAEGYCVATKREQANIVFGDCKRLVASSNLRARITGLTNNLHRDDTSSKLQALGADRDSTDGLNPNLVTLDEAHAMKSRGPIDVMETATGARRQPVINWITTAGNDPLSPCGDQHDYVCRVLDGTLVDETIFGFIAHADPEDDWRTDRTARKANPNYGVSVKPDDLRALVRKAIAMPSAAAAYQQKRLNRWVNAATPWLSLDGWRQGQTPWTVADLRGEPCWIGVDLSSKIDLTAVAIVFPPTFEADTITVRRRSWRVLVQCLTPEDTLPEREHRDRAPYRQWTQEGYRGDAGDGAPWPYLLTNPGNRIDQDRVRAIVQRAASLFDVQQIGVDPWNAGNLVTDLGETDGFDVIEIPQNLQQMSGPAKDFEADVLDGLVDAASNPLMAYCVGNVVVARDGKDNIYPVKKKSRGRIDPVIATLLARKLASLDAAEPPAEDPELVVVG